MSKKGIIFDLDGTLVNTIADIARVTNFALEKNGFPAHEPKDYECMVGHGLRDLIERALPKDCTNSQKDSVYEVLIREYNEKPVESTLIYPGISGLLLQLNQNSVPFSILSNKLHDITLKIIPILFENIRFSTVLGSRNSVPKKPHPQAAFEISQKMGLSPENIYFVGDSETDIKTAQAAGMIPIGVSWGYRSVEQLRACGSKHIVDSADQILEILLTGKVPS